MLLTSHLIICVWCVRQGELTQMINPKQHSHNDTVFFQVLVWCVGGHHHLGRSRLHQWGCTLLHPGCSELCGAAWRQHGNLHHGSAGYLMTWTYKFSSVFGSLAINNGKSDLCCCFGYLINKVLLQHHSYFISTNLSSHSFDWILYVFPGTFVGWRGLAVFGAIMVVAYFMGTLFVPNSPVWLVSVGRQDAARDVLTHLRGPDYCVEYDLQQIISTKINQWVLDSVFRVFCIASQNKNNINSYLSCMLLCSFLLWFKQLQARKKSLLITWKAVWVFRLY